MIVRPASLPDVPAMMALHEDIIRQGGTTSYLVPLSADRFVENYLTPPDTICCHVAVAGDAVVGFQSLGLWPGLPDGWADIGTFVQPGLQCSGAGAALFQATAAAARKAGVTAINAAIRADNGAGLGYYHKRGFVDYAADPDYCLADGTRVGRICKRFDLPA
jgi:L-amino acid N-acyltransferase YncA